MHHHRPGPAGPQGLQGVQGRPGPTGAMGYPGYDGNPGPQGEKGMDGRDGKDADPEMVAAAVAAEIHLADSVGPVRRSGAARISNMNCQ